MCPICAGQTLDHSNSALALQMKALLREKLAAGDSEEEIKAYFSSPDRYGLSVLASPPVSGFNIALWAIPGAATVVGLGGLYFILRQMRKRVTGHGGHANDDSARLASYLDAAGRELRIGESPSPQEHIVGSKEPGP